MAEEEEFLGLVNTTISNSTVEDINTILEEESASVYWTILAINNAIFLSIILCGLFAHVLIIYTTAKSKRLRSRTNIIIVNWIIFEMISNNIIYPIMHYCRVHDYSFILHLILGNVLLMTMLSSILCLNILLTDSIMLSNKTSFKEFMERFYGILLTSFAFILFWKLFTSYDIYMELLLVTAFFLNTLILVVRILWKQCYRMVKCQKLNPNAELRLHVAMFFLLAKIVVIVLGITSVVYRSSVLMHLSKCWCLSGFYIIVLLVNKDINFKISLCEVLGLNVKNPNDVATMITDEGSNDNFVETCIEN